MKNEFWLSERIIHICLECEISSSCVDEAVQKRETPFCSPSASFDPSFLALGCSLVLT